MKTKTVRISPNLRIRNHKLFQFHVTLGDLFMLAMLGCLVGEVHIRNLIENVDSRLELLQTKAPSYLLYDLK